VSNTYLTIGMITRQMLLSLHNNLIAGKRVTRTWEKEFAKTGAKIGDTVKIRKPPRYQVVKSFTFAPQDYTEEYTTLSINQPSQTGCEWASSDLTLSMDDFDKRFLQPALIPLANDVDLTILSSLLNQVWNATGTPGTTAATDTPFLDAQTLLFNNAATITDDMTMIVTGKSSGRLSSGLAGRYNPQKEISDLYLKGAMGGGLMKGAMGHALGWDFFADQNMPTHVTGAFAGSPLVDGAGQTGASILTKSWTGSVTGLLKMNDIVQFAGVYQLNPVTFINTGELQNFRMTADVNSTSGAATLPIDPPIILTGKDATVSAAPADGAVVTVWGTATVANVASKTSPQNFGWQPLAVTLACVDLYMPEEGMGVKAMRVADDDLGLSFLYMTGFDPRQYSKLARIDMLYGTTATRPEHVVRVAN
jgi:hypothetical protein